MRSGHLRLGDRRFGGHLAREDDSLDAVECFRVAGRYAHNPIEVWIDKKSYQVRRIDERMKFDDFRTEQTTTYDPTIDEKIADKLLEFDPPVEN